jgi:predicted 3-demethylubiquinone-9 3-methyltransferase (glyoxalase superfamily)
MQTVAPFLWFDGDAEKAVELYTSVVPNSKVVAVHRWAKGMPFPEGTVMTIEFELGGTPYIAFNGGPEHKFNQSFSLTITCDTQAEIDRAWERLTADGGREVACGWLTDRFGLSWQVVPKNIGKLIQHPRAGQAMMQMVKLDIAALERAARD